MRGHVGDVGRKHLIAGCVALPFVTGYMAGIVNPATSGGSHAASVAISLLVALALALLIALREETEDLDRHEVTLALAWPLIAALTCVLVVEVIAPYRPDTIINETFSPPSQTPRGPSPWYGVFALIMAYLATMRWRPFEPLSRERILEALFRTARLTGGVLLVSLIASDWFGVITADSIGTIAIALISSFPAFLAYLLVDPGRHGARRDLPVAVAACLMICATTAWITALP